MFAFDGRCFINYICYAFSLIFMEQIYIVTVFILHFVFLMRWIHTIQYILCVIVSLIVTVVGKMSFGRTRPDVEEI